VSGADTPNSTATKQVLISRLHWPVTALGPGRRIGIWFQGCSIGCPGCCSRDTWDADPTHAVPLATVVDWVRAKPLDEVEGFTISGGEPFEQPVALRALLRALRALPAGPVARDILVYSGQPWQRLQRQHSNVLTLADVIISEPFVQSQPDRELMGSGNQRLHRLTPLGHERYPETAASDGARALQLHFDGQAVWMIGIPQRGSLEEMSRRLASAGVVLADCSWVA